MEMELHFIFFYPRITFCCGRQQTNLIGNFPGPNLSIFPKFPAYTSAALFISTLPSFQNHGLIKTSVLLSLCDAGEPQYRPNDIALRPASPRLDSSARRGELSESERYREATLAGENPLLQRAAVSTAPAAAAVSRPCAAVRRCSAVNSPTTAALRRWRCCFCCYQSSLTGTALLARWARPAADSCPTDARQPLLLRCCRCCTGCCGRCRL